MRLSSSLMIATLLATPIAARAQPFDGIYIGAGGGGNFAETKSAKVGALRLQTDPGGVGLGSIGYGFGNGVRVEIEGNYRENKASKLRFNGVTSTATGSVRSYGGMANVLFDIDIGVPTIYPYLGAGIGFARSEIDRKTLGGATTYRKSNDNDHLAYQAIAGTSFPIAGVPGLSLTAEYRFFGQDGNASSSTERVAPGRLATGRVKFNEQFDHSLLVGVRYAFNVTPPPAEPASNVVAPRQEAARSYLVFFDWDRADLTTRARQIISEAAQNSTRVQYTKIEVNGYTDTSGTPAYNQRLSVRRAQAVAAELVRDGVPRPAIAIQGFGETNLLVPTAQGVREPQNRRVEIIIR